MRIVGGRWKGRALVAVGKGDAAARLRPTTDRVRESLFNVLAHGDYPELDGAHVLDLFAGTGALGLEALSRGGAHATFVEEGRVALGLLAKNLDLLDAAGQATVLKADATRLPKHRETPVSLVFADPPYGRGLAETALLAAARGKWLAPDAVLVVEDRGATPPPEGFAVLEERRYGDSVLTILRWHPGA